MQIKYIPLYHLIIWGVGDGEEEERVWNISRKIGDGERERVLGSCREREEGQEEGGERVKEGQRE